MESIFLTNGLFGYKGIIDNYNEKLIDHVFEIGNKFNIKIDNMNNVDHIFEIIKKNIVYEKLNLPIGYNCEIIKSYLVILNLDLIKKLRDVFKQYINEDLSDSKLLIEKKEDSIINYIKKRDDQYHLLHASTNLTSNSSDSTIYYSTFQCLSSQSIPDVKQTQISKIGKKNKSIS